jgi:hypothetical protein
MGRGPQHLFKHRRSPGIRAVVAWLVVAGLVAVGGLWVVLRARGSNTASAPTPSVTAPTAHGAEPSISGTPKVRGVVVLVLNGTTRARLAARTSEELARAGYRVAAPGNTARRTSTLIAYQPGFGPDAAFIRRKFLPDASLKQQDAPFPSGAKITVLLGSDAPG